MKGDEAASAKWRVKRREKKWIPYFFNLTGVHTFSYSISAWFKRVRNFDVGQEVVFYRKIDIAHLPKPSIPSPIPSILIIHVLHKCAKDKRCPRIAPSHRSRMIPTTERPNKAAPSPISTPLDISLWIAREARSASLADIRFLAWTTTIYVLGSWESSIVKNLERATDIPAAVTPTSAVPLNTAPKTPSRVSFRRPNVVGAKKTHLQLYAFVNFAQ